MISKFGSHIRERIILPEMDIPKMPTKWSGNFDYMLKLELNDFNSF
jgi:hypothetical protein